MRAAVTRAREKAMEEGAADFITESLEGIARMAEYIWHPHHCEIGYITVPFADDQVQVKGITPDKAARALQIMLELRAELISILTGDSQGEDASDPLRHARKAAKRTRLLDSL